MKKIFIFLLFSTNIYWVNHSKAQTPKILWWYNTHDFSAGQCAAQDIDDDGKYEVVFGCYRNDSNIYVLNAEDGSLLWKFNTSAPQSHGCNDVASVIYDVDNDGNQEVIVPSSCNPKTYCFNGKDGTIKWVCNTRGSDSPPTIADIDNDNKPEILHGEFNGYVICINAEDGSVDWEILVDSNSWIQTAPSIVDLDGDKQLDFVVATWNFDNKDSIFAFNGNTHKKMWSYPVNSHIYHGTGVADLDGDGKPELVIGAYNDTLYCLNGENGSINWKYKGAGYVGGPVSLGDLDLDGTCDIVFPSGDHVTAISNNGKLKWDYTLPDFGQSFRGVALSDITNDSKLDVVFGTSKGDLITLNGIDGKLIWKLNLAAHYGNSDYALQHAPIIADFNMDDTLDIFIAGGYGIYSPTDMTGNFGRAYMISAGKGKGPEWLMFQKDVKRSSSMFGYKPTDVKHFPEITQNALNIYPNPSNQSITLSFSNKNNEKCSLMVYNSESKIIKIIENIYENEVTLDLAEWGNGVYFFRLQRANGNSEVSKFLIQK